MARNPLDAGTSHPIVKVMHVITSLDVGGAETILARLVAADQEGSVTHTVVSLKPGGALRGSLEATGNPVLDLGIGRKLSALSDLARLTKLIKTTQPDIVHSWLYHADLFSDLGGRSLGQAKMPPACSGGSGARTWTCSATRAATATS